MKSPDKDLGSIEIFSSLDRDDLVAIGAICVPVNFEVGDLIAREGSNASELFAFLDGKVEIWFEYGNPNADLLAITQAPCLVGEMSIADELPRSASIVAQTRITGYSMDADKFRQLLHERGSIALSLMRGISRIVRSSNDSFVNEIRNRNRELVKANSELKQIQKQLIRQERLLNLGKFSSMIMHDLRNPLSVIKGYADMLQLKIELLDSMPQEIMRFISKIRRETSRLTGLTNEWLDYSRNEIRLVHSPVTPRDLLERLKENVEAGLKSKDISVKWELGYNETVLIDVDRILRVLVNLVDNARKACARGGNVMISIYRKKDNLRFTVEDDGVGMNQETQTHIFDPFYSSSDQGGSGLGMHIVKTVVEAHGGSIQIASEEGKGTQVNIELPLRI